MVKHSNNAYTRWFSPHKTVCVWVWCVSVCGYGVCQCVGVVCVSVCVSVSVYVEKSG